MNWESHPVPLENEIIHSLPHLEMWTAVSCQLTTTLTQFLWKKKLNLILEMDITIWNLEIPFLICSKAVQLSDFYGLDCKCAFSLANSWYYFFNFDVRRANELYDCMKGIFKTRGDTVYKCIFVKAIFMISMFYGSSYLKSGDIALKCLQHNTKQIVKDLWFSMLNSILLFFIYIHVWKQMHLLVRVIMKGKVTFIAGVFRHHDTEKGVFACTRFAHRIHLIEIRWETQLGKITLDP